MKPLDLVLDLLPRTEFRGRGDLQVRLVHVIEEGEELIILALTYRVVLVVVALSTTDRQAQKHGAGRVDPIDDRLDAELFDIDPPFLVDRRIAVEPGCDPLRERRAGLQITGDLIDDESIEWHVGIERGDHPIAVFPDRA